MYIIRARKTMSKKTNRLFCITAEEKNQRNSLCPEQNMKISSRLVPK